MEVSQGTAGAHCGRLLSEQGAETVLVEPPEGHPLREQAPFANEDPGTERSLMFAHYCMNKRGVTIDLQRSAGQALFDELVATADIVITDHPADHPLRKNTLSYERLKGVNPDVVLTSITPYGLSGPKSEYKAADITIQAEGGFTEINGHPERPPLRLPHNQAAHMGALNAMNGTLAALFYRDFNGGEGQHVDVSQQEAILVHLEHHLQLETFNGNSQNPLFPDYRIARRSGRFFTPGVPIGIFPTKDGAVCLAGAQEHEIRAMVEFFGGKLAELQDEGVLDDLLTTGTSGREPDIVEAIEESTKQYNADQLEREGQEAGIAISTVKDPEEILDDAHFRENGFIKSVSHPEIGEMEDVGPGARTRSAKREQFSPPPLLGEHNEEIFAELNGASPEATGEVS